MTSNTGFLCVLLLSLLVLALTQNTDQTSCAHTIGRGCTTTTVCNPLSDQVRETTQARPGKRGPVGPVGPVGPKGMKGDKSENDQEELAEMKRKFLKLEEKVEQLQASSKLHLRYPTACSDYHDDDDTENLEHVSISYWKSRDQGLTIANCTRLDVIRSITSYPFEMKVPTNSVIARTLIIEGRPVRPHTFRVDFLADSPERILFHMSVRTQLREVVRNDNSGTSDSGWNAEERTSGNAYPFRFGKRFRMEIKTDDIGFHVKLDGRKLLTFRHRQRPVTAVARIVIEGTLHVTFLSFN